MTIQQAIDQKIEFYMDMSEKAQKYLFKNRIFWIGYDKSKIHHLDKKYLHVHRPGTKEFGYTENKKLCEFIKLSCIQK